MAPGKRKVVGDRQSELNDGTRGQWALFASHRRRIEQLLHAAAPKPGGLLLGAGQKLPGLCVLGAGNCNDLDLHLLAGRFAQIHLLDIDAAALEQAIHRQNAGGLKQLQLHAPVDLTSITPLLDGWLGTAPTPAQVAAAIDSAASAPAPAAPGSFDVVLSSCVLSQLISPARDRLGADHEQFPALRKAIISRHLRMMLQLLKPGGCAVFISDVVSSDTEPGLAQVPHEQLPELMRTLVQRRRTFRGLDPAAISTVVKGLAVRREFFPPWLWHLSPRRSYLVYAMLLCAA